jgi:hypothetical protein
MSTEEAKVDQALAPRHSPCDQGLAPRVKRVDKSRRKSETSANDPLTSDAERR